MVQKEAIDFEYCELSVQNDKMIPLSFRMVTMSNP